jgi:tRNA threonylcarbamoyladenosine biosynthesis protein TsaE
LTDSHPPILETRRLLWSDEAGCEAFAQALAVRPGIARAFIELQGPLGAGKTTFVRHLLRALGVAGRIKSPTYTVMEPYTLADGSEVAHFDFYRFSDPREWLDAGFREVFARPGLKLVEWPTQAAGLLPVPDLRLLIEPLVEPLIEPPVESQDKPPVEPQDMPLVEPLDEPHGEQCRQVRLQAFSPLGVALLP